MKIAKYILTALVAVNVSLQSASFLPVSAANTALADPDLSYLYDEENNYYCIAVGMHDVECIVPTEYNGKKVGKLNLDHVFIADYDFPADVKTDTVILHVPDDIAVDGKYWLAEQTGVPCIMLAYGSGKTETFLSADYESLLEKIKTESENDISLTEAEYKNMMLQIVPYNTGRENREYPILETGFKYDRGFSTYKENGHTYIKIMAFMAGKDIYLPEVLNGQKIDRLKLGDITDPRGGSPQIGKLVFPACPMEIERSTLNKPEIKEIVFSGDVTLPAMAFYGNQFLEDVTFKGKAELDNTAFWKCEKLKNINISPDEFPAGVTFNQCRDLMTINGESPVNDDGSIKPEYEKMFKEKFFNTDGIGFVNKYVDYRVKQAVNEAVTDDMSDIEKVKALHDKLCSMTRYDHGNTEDPKNHVDVSVFLNDSTVCEGYARAMNLMLHEAGVESCYVDTDTHAWVIVKLGDHYFHVDPTWDDNDEDITTYNWFMKADSEIKDDPSHSNWKMRCPSVMHNFQWEKMPACEEKMGDVNSDDMIDGRDATDILTAYAKSSAGGGNSVDAIIADYDYNGIIDARDATAVLTAYAKASASEGE